MCFDSFQTESVCSHFENMNVFLTNSNHSSGYNGDSRNSGSENNSHYTSCNDIHNRNPRKMVSMDASKADNNHSTMKSAMDNNPEDR